MENPSVQLMPDFATDSPGSITNSTIYEFVPSISADWDRFVHDHPQGSFFHLTGWKQVLEKTFGYQARYIYASRNGKISAVAPLFLISNWVTGRSLISVPFGVYGGICSSDTESESELLSYIKRLAKEERVDYLELRTRSGEPYAGFHPNPRYETFTTTLDADPEINLKRLPRDTRYMIRKAAKSGLRAEHGWVKCKEFYPLFAQNLKNHGTPAFPESLLENLAEAFPKQLDLMMVYSGRRPVSGVLSFFFRDTILPYYSGAAPEAQRLAANNFMYWELMKWASQSGIRHFDFGRSKVGTGAHAFKTQWNMTVEPLRYQVHLVERKTVPNFSPANAKFDAATRMWRKLPLWLTVKLGPRIVRWFP